MSHTNHWNPKQAYPCEEHQEHLQVRYPYGDYPELQHEFVLVMVSYPWRKVDGVKVHAPLQNPLHLSHQGREEGNQIRYQRGRNLRKIAVVYAEGEVVLDCHYTIDPVG